MKIVSYNIRGAGSRVKRKEVHDLIEKLRVDFCCLQETKLEQMDDRYVRLLWGESNVGWAARESVGRSGGVLTIWNVDNFSMASCWHMSGAVIVNGYWGVERTECCIINVYAPCPLEERLDLWDRLNYIIQQNNSDCCLCLVGDFNSIRYPGERCGRSNTFMRRDVESFDNFIIDAGVIDLPLNGRKFTWYKQDGSYKSRLDRAMINCNWATRWPSSSQRGLPRSISDYCPLLLE